MGVTGYCAAALWAVTVGLDRTAVLQVMISRPIVAAPLTGWLVGEPATGLLVGLLVELLWLGRLPVGATIPPDDTQVAVGATVLAVSMGAALDQPGGGFTVLCVLVAIPLGKAGQLFDRLARHWNGRLLPRAERLLDEGQASAAVHLHLWGLLHFALAALATFGFIVAAGSLVLVLLAPPLEGILAAAALPLQMVLPLIGVAVILATINVNRAFTLFGASFVSALLMLWLL